MVGPILWKFDCGFGVKNKRWCGNIGKITSHRRYRLEGCGLAYEARIVTRYRLTAMNSLRVDRFLTIRLSVPAMMVVYLGHEMYDI